MLDAKGADVRRERNSRKEPLSDAEARELLGRATKVVVAQGRKTKELAAGEAGPADLRGPTGSYRAPMLLKGRTLIVGFNAEALDRLL